MPGFGYACAAVLATVFVRAAVAKAVRAEHTGAGFAALGVPSPAVAARAVPLVELALAVVLLGAPRVGAVAAIVLLAGFSVVLARAVRRGVAVGCNCFGAPRVDAVSSVDLARNAMLATLALAALFAPRATKPSLAAVAGAAGVVILGVLGLRAARAR
jgi:hypothetical protein